MKVLGWMLTLLGGGGLIGTLIARDSNDYKIDGWAGIIGMDEGYKTTVDMLFYIAIGVLILGVILLVIGYFSNEAKGNNQQPVHYSGYPQANNIPANAQAAVCPSCNLPVSGQNQFCANCGQRIR